MSQRRQRVVAQRTRGLRRWVAVAALASGCAGTGDARAVVRRSTDTPERTSGCIDTPFIGGDPRATTTGLVCGREASQAAAMLRGRVIAEELGGLPGAGLEDLWVTIHLIDDGPLNLDALPPAKAQAKTGPQGSFSIALGAGGVQTYLVAVRREPQGPLLTARQIHSSREELASELVLMVPEPSPEPSAPE